MKTRLVAESVMLLRDDSAFFLMRTKEKSYTRLVPKIPRQYLKDLYSLLALPKNEKEMALLLSDLLSPKELAVFAERWQLVRMLKEGMPQRAIAKKLGVSISKVTRGSHALQHGKGGFNRFLKTKKTLRTR